MKELIIGASGFLGSKLAKSDSLKESNLTYFNNKSFSKKDNYSRYFLMDLSNKDEVFRVLKETKPTLIIHCGGITDTDFCEKEKDYSWKVNVDGVKTLMSHYDGKIIYFSTDYVFDGENPPYDENSRPNPINYYGSTKLQAEKLVLRNKENLVIRVSGLFGANDDNDKFLNKIRKGKVKTFTNLFSSPTYIDDIANNMPKLIKQSGIIHMSSQESISRYNFLKICTEYLRLQAIIEPDVYDQKQSIVKRPYNTTLITQKGLSCNSIKTALEDMQKMI